MAKKFNSNINNAELTYGYYKYTMPKEAAKDYLIGIKDKKILGNPKEYLRNIVNEEYGIKGHCTEVIIG